MVPDAATSFEGLSERVRALESQNRLYRRVASLGVLLLGCGLLLGQDTPSSTSIRAQEFLLTDAEDHVLMRIDSTRKAWEDPEDWDKLIYAQFPELVLQDARGRRQIVLGSGPDGGFLHAHDVSGTKRAALTFGWEAGLELFDEKGERFAFFGDHDDEGPALLLGTDQHRFPAGILTNRSNSGLFVGKEEGLGIGLGVYSSGEAGLILHGDGSPYRGFLGIYKEYCGLSFIKGSRPPWQENSEDSPWPEDMPVHPGPAIDLSLSKDRPTLRVWDDAGEQVEEKW